MGVLLAGVFLKFAAVGILLLGFIVLFYTSLVVVCTVRAASIAVIAMGVEVKNRLQGIQITILGNTDSTDVLANIDSCSLGHYNTGLLRIYMVFRLTLYSDQYLLKSQDLYITNSINTIVYPTSYPHKIFIRVVVDLFQLGNNQVQKVCHFQ